MTITSSPYGAVCYILADIPGVGEFQASGVIIGPHTILTAAHEVWDADTGRAADAVSIYPGYEPTSTTSDPTGALPGLQSIHYIKVADNNDEIAPSQVKSDFAVINTSTDLTAYGKFALDADFSGGDVILAGYPASKKGSLFASEGVVSVNAAASTINYGSLELSAGDSGGPLWTKITRNGVDDVPAVTGIVSTNAYANKLTKAKIALIRHWIAVDHALYAGSTSAARGITPQISGTVSNSVNAARVGDSASTLAAAVSTPFVYSDADGASSGPGHAAASQAHPLSDLVAALHGASSSGFTHRFLAASSAEAASRLLAAPVTVAAAVSAPKTAFTDA